MRTAILIAAMLICDGLYAIAEKSFDEVVSKDTVRTAGILTIIFIVADIIELFK